MRNNESGKEHDNPKVGIERLQGKRQFIDIIFTNLKSIQEGDAGGRE